MIYSRIEPSRPDITAAVNGVGAVIGAVGTDAFCERFAELMFNNFRVSEYLVFRRSNAKDAPVGLISKSIDNASASRARAYCSGFFRLDPIYSVLDGSNPDGTYAIRIRKEEIHNAVFKDACYTRPGLSEKLTLANKAGDKLIAISVFGREADGGLDSAQINELSHFGSLLLPILDLHFRLVGNTERQKQVSANDMENCVAWAFPELTSREVAVCARTILGVTAEGIALDLGIKQTSVLTYRRRAYARLNINSINQLSTMLIQSSAARQLAAA